MPEPNRVVIDSVDWKRVLPVLRLASAFKHALQPGKLLIALLAILAIHLSGTVLDLMWGDPIVHFDRKIGPYESFVFGLGQLFAELTRSILSFDLGLGTTSGVVGALHGIFLGSFQWLFTEHPWFAILFCADVLFVLAITTGILTRMAATQVCSNRLTPLSTGIAEVTRRWVWYLLTPFMPAILIAVVGAVLALVGLALFNLPVLDIVGSVLYGVLLLLGFIAAVVGLLLLLSLFLMPPALSVEGSDGFDAIARSFNYILFRPWQFATYLLSALAYLALVYIIVGTVASMSVSATNAFIEIGSFAGTDQSELDDESRFEVIVANLANDAKGSIGFSAWIMARWLELVGAMVAAILLSTFCCLQTQVYVLMRRSADGTPMDQCDAGEPKDLWTDAPDTPADSDDTGKAED